jgi:hypothetical protein
VAQGGCRTVYSAATHDRNHLSQKEELATMTTKPTAMTKLRIGAAVLFGAVALPLVGWLVPAIASAEHFPPNPCSEAGALSAPPATTLSPAATLAPRAPAHPSIHLG